MTVRTAIASEFARRLKQCGSRALETTMMRMDELGCWRECISQFAVGRQDVSLGTALLSLWTTYGFRIAKGLRSEITVLVDALRQTLPKYAGQSVTLYRGELAERYSARSFGIAWTPDLDVAVMFANRRFPDEGQGVVLRVEASVEMIVAAPTDHSKWLQEKEYIVDPRMITTIEVLRPINDLAYPSTTAQMNAENRKFWSDPTTLTAAAWSMATDYRAGTQKQLHLKGATISADARRKKSIERARRIHDSHKNGKKTKAIAGDEGMSISQVNRALQKPRP